MSATVLRIETIVILKLSWVQQNNLFQDWKPLQTMSESIVQWLYSIFFFIMILDLIKWSSRCWPQKKVQIKRKEKVRVQQRRVKAHLTSVTNTKTTSIKSWETAYITWDPHKLRPWMTHKQKQPSLETRPNFPSVDFAGKRKGLRVRHQPASKEK
jgi:hypothetical protein